MTSDAHGQRIIAFLDHHRLSHSPGHYAFAHRVLFSHDESFRKEVRSLTDGGLRLTPAQVSRFMPILDGSSSQRDPFIPALDRIVTHILNILSTATHEADAFGRDLTAAAVELVGSDARRIHSVVAKMIAQTERAEAQLDSVIRKTAKLREELTAMRNEAELDTTTLLLNRLAIDAVMRVALERSPTRSAVALVAIDQAETIEARYKIGVVERVVRALGETLRDHCIPHRVGRWETGSLLVVFEQSLDLLQKSGEFS